MGDIIRWGHTRARTCPNVSDEKNVLFRGSVPRKRLNGGHEDMERGTLHLGDWESI